MVRYGKKKERKLPGGLSPSSIDLYLQCPRKYEAQKIDGLWDPPGIEAVLGTFVHKILEDLMEMPEDERTLEAAKVCAREAWPSTEENGNFKRLRLNEQKSKAFRWSAWKSVENYFTMEDPTKVKVEATEGWIRCEVNGVPLRGILDRLDREGDDLVIADYKNGKIPAEKYRKSKWDQLNLYAGMVMETREEMPKVGRLIFTAHSEILEVPFTEDSVGGALNQAKEVWENVHMDFEGRGFAANPGPLCGWCPLLEKCPEGMGFTHMQFKKGRLKKSAPGYGLVSKAALDRRG